MLARVIVAPLLNVNPPEFDKLPLVRLSAVVIISVPLSVALPVTRLKFNVFNTLPVPEKTKVPNPPEPPIFNIDALFEDNAPPVEAKVPLSVSV